MVYNKTLDNNEQITRIEKMKTEIKRNNIDSFHTLLKIVLATGAIASAIAGAIGYVIGAQ